MTEQYIKDYDQKRAEWEELYPKFVQSVNPKELTHEQREAEKARLRKSKWGDE